MPDIVLGVVPDPMMGWKGWEEESPVTYLVESKKSANVPLREKKNDG
jgi:hypothetical protein